MTEEEKLSVNDIEKALVFYDGIEKLNKASDDLQKKINRADSESKQAINSLKRIKSRGPQVQAEFIAHLKTLSLAQLEAELNSLLAKLQTEQADLASFSAQLVGLQTQPERAQSIMMENARRLQEIRDELNGTLNRPANLRPTQTELLQIEQYYLQQQNDFQKRYCKPIPSYKMYYKNSEITALNLLKY